MNQAGMTIEDLMTTRTLKLIFQSVPLARMTLPLAMLLSAMAGYMLLLVFPPVVEITGILYLVRIWTAALLVLVFWLVFRGKGRVWETISLTLVLGLFAVSLAYKWQTAYCDGNLIGGLLPWSDASGYFKETFTLLSGERLSSWGTRRPLFVNFLAVLFFFTGSDLQWTLAILVAINAVAVYVAAREVRRTYGVLSAALFTALCYLFYRVFAGKTLTENTGFAFGTLGFAFLLRSARERRFRDACCGLFLLTVALNARAGAFLVLPALIFWITVTFRGSVRAWKAAGIGILAVLLGFGANFVFVRVTGAPGGVPFSNYSLTFYGLAAGNKGWTQVMLDHPGVREEDVPRLALEKFKENPGRLFVGMTHAYFEYFWPGRGAFGFLQLAGSRAIRYTVSCMMWILSGLGLWAAVRLFKSAEYSLLLAGAVGIFASVSLVPPIDTVGMRAYAATVPISICIAAAGTALPREWLQKRRWARPPVIYVPDALALHKPLSIALLSLSLVLPLAVFVLARPGVNSPGRECASGQQEYVTVAGSGAFVNLIPDSGAAESYMPNIRISDFRKSIGAGTPYPLLDQELLLLKPGQAVSASSNGFVVAEPHPLSPGAHSLCATPTRNEWLRSHGYYYVGTKYQGGTPAAETIISRHAHLARIARMSFGLGLVLIILISGVDCVRGIRSRTRMEE